MKVADQSASMILAANISAAAAIDGNTSAGYDEYGPGWSLRFSVTAGCIIGVMIIATAIGNIFVISAVVRERQLKRSLANKLVASLAFTDLLVGLLVMPLAAGSLVMGSWPFGWIMCDVYIVLDVSCCTASILHLVAIALDRYWSFTDIAYNRGSKKYRYFFPVAVSGTWILSILICLPPFFGWRIEQTRRECVISQDKGYTIYSTVGAFYLPLVIIIVIYSKVFMVVRKRARGKGMRRPERPLQSSNTMPNIEIEVAEPLKSSETTMTLETSLSSSPSSDHIQPSPTDDLKVTSSCPDLRLTKKSAAKNESSIQTLLQAVPVWNYIRKGSPTKVRDKIAARRERRALRTLLVITGVFITCWLPFFVFAVLIPFCGLVCNVPMVAVYIVTWLGYFNSMLNPIIYTIFSADFRTAFRRLLCGR